MIHCLLLLATLVGGMRPCVREGVRNLALQKAESILPRLDEIIPTGASPGSKASVRGLRAKRRDIRLDIPEPGQVAFDIPGSRRRPRHYEGGPLPEREHVSPPSAGPPGPQAFRRGNSSENLPESPLGSVPHAERGGIPP